MKSLLVLIVLFLSSWIAKEGTRHENILPTVYFEHNSTGYALKGNTNDHFKDTMDVLLFLVSALKQEPNFIYKVVGCINDKEEAGLGKERAKKVYEFLVLNHVPKENLEVEDSGTGRPQNSKERLEKAKTRGEKNEMHAYNSRVFIQVVRQINRD